MSEHASGPTPAHSPTPVASVPNDAQIVTALVKLMRDGVSVNRLRVLLQTAHGQHQGQLSRAGGDPGPPRGKPS